MIKDELKSSLQEKIRKDELAPSDIPAYLILFCHLGNQIEDLQDEVLGWNRKIQFTIEESGTYWISIIEGQFSTGVGKIENADLYLSLPVKEAVQIFSGVKSAEELFTTGVLKFEGDLMDGAKLQEIIEIVIEEIENA